MAPRKPGRGHGTVVDWFDDRGYGFIETGRGARVFFHVSALRERQARAAVGDRATFTVGPGRDGRDAAFDVAIEGAEESPFAPESSRAYAALVLVALAMLAFILDRILPWFLLCYLVMGSVSAMLYTLDKRAAQKGEWRVPEGNLHTTDLAGGIIGGLLAQHILRHKTSKPGFAGVTWGIALLHAGLLIAAAFGVFSSLI
jgi:uncharacterized membrane protein YsdA (DUF1294 family)/cold shock CspA family protein